MTLLHQESHLLHKISYQLKSDSSNLIDKISKIQEHNKNLEQELQQLKAQHAKQKSISLSDSAQQITGGKLLVKQVDNIAPEMLKTLVDSLKQELKSAIIVLATKQDNKVNVIVGVTKNLTNKIPPLIGSIIDGGNFNTSGGGVGGGAAISSGAGFAMGAASMAAA
ncbi:DHH family phosphoesterase, partial [Candidatus Regiella insecticola]